MDFILSNIPFNVILWVDEEDELELDYIQSNLQSFQAELQQSLENL